MLFMNDYDLGFARSRFGRGKTPNRLALVMVVDNLREWTNCHSDGWAYWPKPTRAAASAMQHIASRTNAENEQQERYDISDRDMMLAVMPIKSFMTRHGVSPEWRERILRSVNS